MLWSVAIMKINWSRQPQNTKEHGLSQKSDSAEPVDDHGLWNSRPLDVHTWSEHPEVNTFVDEIYREHFEGGNESIRKKHLKVLLLDLYMAWCDDPDLKIAVHRNTNQYKARSRYNSLHISSITPTIVDRLVEVALIDFHNGFNDRRRGGRSRLSRIWPTEALLDKFQVARFGPLDISHHDGKECIVLRDIDGETVEYKDTPKIRRMREHLKAYNDLLSQTYIDIPSLETNYIDLGIDTNGKPSTAISSTRVTSSSGASSTGARGTKVGAFGVVGGRGVRSIGGATTQTQVNLGSSSTTNQPRSLIIQECTL